MLGDLARSSRTAILAISIALAILFIVLTVMQAFPYEIKGFSIDGMTGRLTHVHAGSPARKAGVRTGDTLLDPPHGDTWRGIRLVFTNADDLFRIMTPRGIVTVAPMRYAPLDDSNRADTWADIAADISVIVVLGFATLLYLRRPGPMAFSFWLYAATSWSLGQFYPLFARIPHYLDACLMLPLGGVVGFAFAVPLIPFALRFPDDRLSAPRARWERIAWASYGVAVAAGIWYYALYWGGVVPTSIGIAILYAIPSLPIPIAAAILIATYIRADQQRRAQLAWALVGFVGSLLFTFAAQNEVTLSRLTIIDDAIVEFLYSAISVIGNLFPLLAIYPILRFRLFDIGFVVSRATLYSMLTLAAFTTLAGVNWIAQRLVNDRIATVLQPGAAIVIGLGYFRVREWIKELIERILFRERLAAEREVDALTASLQSAQTFAEIDQMLTVRAARTLSLQSAALFRSDDGGLRRAGAAVGWDAASLDYLRSDDELVAALEGSHRVVSLQALGWSAHGEPDEPARPVAAIALRHGSTLLGVGLYGRHVNGTEIDPEEMNMLRRLCEAAAACYDGAALRAKIAELQSQLAAQARA